LRGLEAGEGGHERLLVLERIHGEKLTEEHGLPPDRAKSLNRTEGVAAILLSLSLATLESDERARAGSLAIFRTLGDF
jgi:hypothetical protein